MLPKLLTRLSRRDFARILGGTGAALTLPAAALTLPAAALTLPAAAAADSPGTPATSSSTRRFPQGFLWGSATASYQVEGAVHEDGRGPSIWDTFSHAQGRTHGGETGDNADDFYHRYTKDIALMKSYGVKVFRFSVSWTRIFPNGTGQPNQKGIDFYKRLTSDLREAHIEPFCTLYHWDLPQALEDKGGWQKKDTAKAFADYAGYTAGKLAGSFRPGAWMPTP